jgi:hypothetical protein
LEEFPFGKDFIRKESPSESTNYAFVGDFLRKEIPFEGISFEIFLLLKRLPSEES